MRGNGLNCPKGGSGQISGRISSQSNEALAQAAQGSDGVTVPGGVQEKHRCGTEGPGLVDTGGMGSWLDWVILVVFSSLYDSIISLCFSGVFFQHWAMTVLMFLRI